MFKKHDLVYYWYAGDPYESLVRSVKGSRVEIDVIDDDWTKKSVQTVSSSMLEIAKEIYTKDKDDDLEEDEEVEDDEDTEVEEEEEDIDEDLEEEEDDEEEDIDEDLEEEEDEEDGDEEDGDEEEIPAPGSRRPVRDTGKYINIDEIKEVVKKALKVFRVNPSMVHVKFTRGGLANGGWAKYNRVTQIVTIGLNKRAWPVISENERIDTILHEAAHAIDFIVNSKQWSSQSGMGAFTYRGKRRTGHDDEWKRIAKKIGCSAEVCMSPEASESIRRAHYGEALFNAMENIDYSKTKDDFIVGEKVSFPARDGFVKGKIKKLNLIKAVIIDEKGSEWRVSYGWLTSLKRSRNPAHDYRHEDDSIVISEDEIIIFD